MRTFFKLLITSFILLSCKSNFITGGYLDDNQITELTKNNFSKEYLESNFGTPSLVSLDGNWYYIGITTSRRAFLNPKIEKQQIVKITFIDNVSTSVDIIENSSTDIDINPNYTKSLGIEKSDIHNFIHNLGRFNKKNKKDQS